MSAIKIKKTHFSGGSHVPGTEDSSLGAIVRAVAVDMARRKFEDATFSGLTDNGGGTNNTGGVPALSIPTADFDASAAGGSTRTTVNNALLTHADAQAQCAEYINDLRYPLGLAPLNGDNVAHSSAVIAAITSSTTGGTGTNVSTRTSIAAAFTAVRNNWATLARAANEVAAALDYTRLTDNTGGKSDVDLFMVAVPATTASADGTDSVSKVDIDAFLLASKHACKTVTTFLNAIDDATADQLRAVAAD